MSNFNIICDNLSKSFSGKTLFKDLSFSISAHGSLSVTGRNGSGKSTLMKILANLIQSSKGKITIQEDNKEIPREKWFLKTGMLSPYINLYDELTALENLNFFYKLKSSLNNDPGEILDSYLQKAGLYEKRNELVKNYSSGMKQKLKLIFAVMNEPEILLMDEPGTNLDSAGIDFVYEISGKQKDKGILIIATNDDKDKNLCDASLNIEEYN